jgi:hypothetical protein
MVTTGVESTPSLLPETRENLMRSAGSSSAHLTSPHLSVLLFTRAGVTSAVHYLQLINAYLPFTTSIQFPSHQELRSTQVQIEKAYLWRWTLYRQRFLSRLWWLLMFSKFAYNNYHNSGHCPSFCIPLKEHDVSETGFCLWFTQVQREKAYLWRWTLYRQRFLSRLWWLLMFSKFEYNNHHNSGHCPSFCILLKEHDVSETGFCLWFTQVQIEKAYLWRWTLYRQRFLSRLWWLLMFSKFGYNNYHNSGHCPSFCIPLKNTTFRRLDSVSVFRWKLLKWAAQPKQLVSFSGPIQNCDRLVVTQRPWWKRKSSACSSFSLTLWHCS